MPTMLRGAELDRVRVALSCLLSPTAFGDDARWREGAAGSLRDLVGADAAFVTLDSASSGTALGLDQEVVRAYERDYGKVDHGIARQRTLRLEVWSRRMLWHRQDLLRSVYYNEFALPSRLYDAVGIAAFAAGRCVRVSLLYASEGRPARPGARASPSRDAQRLRRLRLVLPAFRVGAMLSLCWQHWRESVTRVVDRVAQPLALYSDAGRELHRNPALACEMTLHHAAELREAIRRVSLAATARRLARPDEGSTPHVCVLTTRWRVLGSRVTGPDPYGSEPAVLISLEPRARDALPAGLLHTRYGVTSRELQVLELLRERRSNLEIAGVLGISAHTARHHTEHVLLKLGLSSRRFVAARCEQLARDAAGGTGRDAYPPA